MKNSAPHTLERMPNTVSLGSRRIDSNQARPTPYQTQVLCIPEDHFVFLGGGRGGGKSMALQFLILRHCDQYKARAKILVTRRRQKSLIQFAEEMRALFRSAYGKDVAFNQNDNIFRLPNGATVATLLHSTSKGAQPLGMQALFFYD